MHFILAQAQAQNPLGQYSTIFLFGGMALIFYFFMFRPQQKKQKEAKKFGDDLKKGDHVVTIGGAHGYVHEIEKDTVTLKVESGLVKFNKSAISLEYTKTANAEEKKA